MIPFSDNLKAAMADNLAEMFFCLAIHDVDAEGNITGTFYTTTTCMYDIVIDGTTYAANGDLIDLSAPGMSSSVDRAIYTFSLIDNEFQIGGIDNDLLGRPVSVKMVMTDINAVPLTAKEDVLLVYQGLVHGISYATDVGELGSNIFKITGSSPMFNLDLKKGLYTGDDAVRRRDPTDTSCEYVHEGSQAYLLRWGKE